MKRISSKNNFPNKYRDLKKFICNYLFFVFLMIISKKGMIKKSHVNNILEIIYSDAKIRKI